MGLIMSRPTINTAYLYGQRSSQYKSLSDRVTSRLLRTPRNKWGRCISLYLKATTTNVHAIIIAAYESLLPPENEDIDLD